MLIRFVPRGGFAAGGGCAAAVVAEDELVEVDLEMFRRDAVMGALEPGLEVRECSVGAWQHPLAVGRAGALFTRLVVETGGSQAAIAGPTVGVDDRAGSDARVDETPQRVA